MIIPIVNIITELNFINYHFINLWEYDNDLNQINFLKLKNNREKVFRNCKKCDYNFLTENQNLLIKNNNFNEINSFNWNFNNNFDFSYSKNFIFYYNNY